MTSGDSERSETIARVLRNGEQFRLMAELSTDAIGMALPDGTAIYLNPAGRRLCGIPPDAELSDLRITDFHPDDLQRHVMDAVEAAIDAGTWRGDTELLSQDGKRIPIHQLLIAHRDESGEVSVISTVIRDMTLVRDLEAQLAHAQRLESVGRLAGGVAHDFNNLLTVIENYVELACDSLPPTGPVRDDLAMVLRATERAGALCRQLLSFARKEVIFPEPLDINRVVRQFASLVGRIVGEDVRLELDLEERLRLVLMDPSQLEQILANLVVNARDAMKEGGLLLISTRQIPVWPEGNAHGASCAEWVELVVADTGEGMSDEVRSRVFEPFFTTKGPGRGSGLGLATVYGAVSQNNGTISIRSALGQGTQVTIRWPTIESEPEDGPDTSPQPSRGGAETILVVEDEPMVRQLVVRALGSAGYAVREAESPFQALDLALRHQPLCDMILTDVVMPDMNGRALVERLKPYLSGCPVLYMSGYTDSLLDQGGIINPEVQLLVKPFSRRQLLEKVRAVLDATPQTASLLGP